MRIPTKFTSAAACSRILTSWHRFAAALTLLQGFMRIMLNHPPWMTAIKAPLDVGAMLALDLQAALYFQEVASVWEYAALRALPFVLLSLVRHEECLHPSRLLLAGHYCAGSLAFAAPFTCELLHCVSER